MRAPHATWRAKHAETIAEAATFGEVVITMLENDKALTSVVHHSGGLLQSIAKGGIHVAMGTHGVDLIAELTETHAKAGQVLVSAPVMGRPPFAASGQLGILAGGPADAVAKCQPLFECMGRRVFDCGTAPVGAATAKIANNFCLACAIEAMAEGFVLMTDTPGQPALRPLVGTIRAAAPSLRSRRPPYRSRPRQVDPTK